MEARVYRYTINMGDNGGIVVARSYGDALDKVTRAYEGKVGDKELEVAIWPAREDEFYDPAHPCVCEVY